MWRYEILNDDDIEEGDNNVLFVSIEFASFRDAFDNFERVDWAKETDGCFEPILKNMEVVVFLEDGEIREVRRVSEPSSPWRVALMREDGDVVSCKSFDDLYAATQWFLDFKKTSLDVMPMVTKIGLYGPEHEYQLVEMLWEKENV